MRNLKDFAQYLAPRLPTANKGNFGHALIIGGDYGMGGAVHLAATAALRIGAGLVSVATRDSHVSAVLNTPEIMAHAIDTTAQLDALILRANVIAIGPGLGKGEWSQQLLNTALNSSLPLIVDADALNLLSKQKVSPRDTWILTPHPGEAARLLDTNTEVIEEDRLAAIKKLQARYGGTCVLKGPGTLVLAPKQSARTCSVANPGLASGGMGDVLTGIITSFVAQGFALPLAAEMGVCVQTAAAERAALHGTRGMLASDVIAELRAVINI